MRFVQRIYPHGEAKRSAAPEIAECEAGHAVIITRRFGVRSFFAPRAELWRFARGPSWLTTPPPTRLKIPPQQLHRRRAGQADPKESVHRALLNLRPSLPTQDRRLAKCSCRCFLDGWVLRSRCFSGRRPFSRTVLPVTLLTLLDLFPTVNEDTPLLVDHSSFD